MCLHVWSSKVWSVFLVLILLPAFLAVDSGCHASRRTKGAVIGAATGAAAGAVIVKKNKAVAILLGAAIGGVAGGIIGDYMDQQAAEIKRDLKGAKVERVGEGIVVTFDSGLWFDFDSDALKAATQDNLNQFARTLNKYAETDVQIFGHTDNTGDKAYNLNLSNQRADAVQKYLIQKAVLAKRLTTVGLGENDPIAENTTDAGRQLNRRVELTILANKKLIRDARRGKIPGSEKNK